MIEFLRGLCNAANPTYEFFYNEGAAMNIDTEILARNQGFVYVEEFTGGSFILRNGFILKRPKVEIYFCRFADHEETAEGREAIRDQITTEILIPFIKQLRSPEALRRFTRPLEEINFFNAIPRFDDNEVSILLEFYAPEYIC